LIPNPRYSKGPFTNIPPAIEAQVEFITQVIGDAEKASNPFIEATHGAEQEYSALCEKLAANSLFWKAEGELSERSPALTFVD